MRIIGKGLGIGLGLLVLAGCQAEGEKFQISDQRIPEQLGLRVEWIRQFVREGALSAQPNNPGARIAENGEIAYRLWRLTNVGAETREIFPYVEGGEGRLELDQYEVGVFCAWDEPPPCLKIDLGGPPPPDVYQANIYSRTTRYHTEFVVSGFDFEWTGGGREARQLRSAADVSTTALKIPPGESLSLVVRYRLAPGYGLRPPAKTAPSMLDHRGDDYYPEAPVPGDYGGEFLSGISDAVGDPGVRLLVADPTTAKLNALYFPFLGAKKTLFRQPKILDPIPAIGYPGIEFPPARVARTLQGLPVQY